MNYDKETSPLEKILLICAFLCYVWFGYALYQLHLYNVMMIEKYNEFAAKCDATIVRIDEQIICAHVEIEKKFDLSE